MTTSATEAVSNHPGLLEWLLHGETGVSSKTIVSIITGHMLDQHQSEPYDPSDFRRCELLLRRVPSLRAGLGTMRNVSPWWSYLVDNWDRIVETAEGEIPGCFDGGRPRGSAPKTYALIKAGRGGVQP